MALFSESQAERRALVTPLAIPEIVAAESAPVVMAGGATLLAPAREVLGRARRADLLRLPRAGAEVVTVGTPQTLPRAVIPVAEGDAVGARVG